MDTNIYIEQLNRINKNVIHLTDIYTWFLYNERNLDSFLNSDEKRIDNEFIKKFYVNLKYRITQLFNTSKEIEKISDNLKENKMNPQYENFLNKTLLSINWNEFYLYNDSTSSELKDLEFSKHKNTPIREDQYNLLNIICELIYKGRNLENKLVGIIASLGIFSKIQGLNQNIVIIGGNGSGKSRFSRNLEGKVANGISIIPAQKLLVYNNPKNILVEESMIQNVKDFQKKTKLASEENFINLLTNDLNNLMLALMEEELGKMVQYYDSDKKSKSLLDKTIAIWKTLISHRDIVKTSPYSISVKTPEEVYYEFNDLSDGEKAIFYYIGHVLLAEKNSYIVIDEPENHLYLSICNELWDLLELERSDCKFIYITHNLDFAVSRNRKSLIWNKKYSPPFSWDFEIIQEDDTIPEILLLEIIGNRKNVLFCEGDDKNSLDYKIYTRLFPNLNVIPVGGHEEVIKYCTTINQNQLLRGFTAYGIIDGDVWTPEEVESKRSNNIFVLPFNEIENAMCQKKILEKIVEDLGGKEESVDEFINNFFSTINSSKEKIAVSYANNRINNYIKSNLFKEGRDIEKLKSEVEGFVNSNNIDSFYTERLNQITNDVLKRDYNSLLKYVDAKKKLTKELANKFIVNEFESRFIRLLDRNKEFKQVIYNCILEPNLIDLTKVNCESLK